MILFKRGDTKMSLLVNLELLAVTMFITYVAGILANGS